MFDAHQDDFVDAFWDWDTQDYKSRLIHDPEMYQDKLVEFDATYAKESAVMLLHDFSNNHHLFEATMRFLCSKKVEFLYPHFGSPSQNI